MVFLKIIYSFFLLGLFSDFLLTRTVHYKKSELEFLENIQRENKKKSSTPRLNLIQEEHINGLGTSLDYKKILFYKKIRINRKILQEILLFDANQETLTRYFFENRKNYRDLKKKIVQDNEIILFKMNVQKTTGSIINSPESFYKILLENENNFQKIDFYLGEGRKKHILGKLEFKEILLEKPTVKRVYFLDKDKILIPIISYRFLKDQKMIRREKIIPFYLKKIIPNPKRVVLAKNNFKVTPSQIKIPYLKENYFNFQKNLIAEVNYYLTGKKKETLFLYNGIFEIIR